MSSAVVLFLGPHELDCQSELKTVVLSVWTLVYSRCDFIASVSLGVHGLSVIRGRGKERGKICVIFMVLVTMKSFFLKKIVFACCEAPSGLRPGTGQGINGAMTSVPLWASTALQSAVSLWLLNATCVTLLSVELLSCLG